MCYREPLGKITPIMAEDRDDKQEIAKLKNELKVLIEPHRSYA